MMVMETGAAVITNSWCSVIKNPVNLSSRSVTAWGRPRTRTYVYIYIYIYNIIYIVISPLGVMLLVYRPDTRGEGA